MRQFVPRPVFDIVPHGRLKSSHEVLAGSSKLFDNLVPLVDVVGSREEHPAPDHLDYYTALELDRQHCHLQHYHHPPPVHHLLHQSDRPDHLAHNAAHRPDVYVLLVTHSQDHLRGPE